MAETLNHIEILLAICTTAVALIAILLAIGLYYGILILRSVRNITRTAERTTNEIAGDISDFRDRVKQRGFSLAVLGDIFKNFGRRKRSK